MLSWIPQVQKHVPFYQRNYLQRNFLAENCLMSRSADLKLSFIFSLCSAEILNYSSSHNFSNWLPTRYVQKWYVVCFFNLRRRHKYVSMYLLSTYFNLLLMLVIFLLIIQRCSILKQTIWHSNHTSHKKKYFYEFVANVLRDNIGILIFDLHGGC